MLVVEVNASQYQGDDNEQVRGRGARPERGKQVAEAELIRPGCERG